MPITQSHKWPRGHIRQHVNCQSLLAETTALLVLLTLPQMATANPTISRVEGSIISGEPLIISGSGFGHMTQGLAIKDYADTSTLLLNGTMNLGLTPDSMWQTKGSPWASPLNVSFMPSQTNADNHVYRGKGKTYNGYLSALDDSNQDSLYLAWDYMPSVNPSHSGGSNKFLRIWDNHSGEDTRISWTQMHMTYSGSSSPSWSTWSGNPGQWNRMEIWVDASSQTIVASVNGEVAHRINNFQKVGNGIGLNIKLLGFDPSTSENYADMVTMIDDLYVSTSRARVMLSDKKTWAEARIHGEIQLPTSWSDTQVKFSLDLDGNNAADTRYLYVVDESGLANALGFEICSICPRAPIMTAN